MKSKVETTVKAFEQKGSAFARVALHDLEVLEHQGKIMALDTANAVVTAALNEIEVEAGRVHGVQDLIKARLDALKKSL